MARRKKNDQKDAGEPGPEVKFPATLANVGLGEKALAIGFKIPRKRGPGDGLSLTSADELLTQARLEVRLEQRPANPGQEEMFEGEEMDPLVSVADVSGLLVKSKDVSGRLTFRRGSVTAERLDAWVGVEAIVTARRVGEAGQDRTPEEAE